MPPRRLSLFFAFFFFLHRKIGYHSQPDSHGKHERLSDSGIIKLSFWGVEFKGRPGSAAGGMESLRLRGLSPSQKQFEKSLLTTTGG